MAAYDWGPGNVQRAVSRTGYADFWELYRRNACPRETSAYVPQILAAIIMAKNPEQYGLNKLVPEPARHLRHGHRRLRDRLRLVADVTDSSVPEIVALNPALLRLSTPRDIASTCTSPPGTKDIFRTRLKDIPEDDRGTGASTSSSRARRLDRVAAPLPRRTATLASYNEVNATQADAGRR